MDRKNYKRDQEIYWLHRNEKRTFASIAREYGISTSRVQQICRKQDRMLSYQPSWELEKLWAMRFDLIGIVNAI